MRFQFHANIIMMFAKTTQVLHINCIISSHFNLLLSGEILFLSDADAITHEKNDQERQYKASVKAALLFMFQMDHLRGNKQSCNAGECDTSISLRDSNNIMVNQM